MTRVNASPGVPSRRGRLAALGAGLLLLGAGCGPELDPPSELKTLRVIGVQKDQPYAQPGESVKLSLVFEDASPKAAGAPRPINVAWIGGCWNPPGDLYAGCFSDIDPARIQIGGGSEFTVDVPVDVIAPRTPPNPAYGLSYVFFAVCAGDIELATDAGEGLPIRCRDSETDAYLGSTEFVAGYSAIYVFGRNGDGEPYANQNPRISGFQVRGQELVPAPPNPAALCLDDGHVEPERTTPSCLPTCADPDAEGRVFCENPALPAAAADVPEAARLPACPEDGDPIECTGYGLRPILNLDVPAEIDAVSRDSYGRSFQEQMWVNYYTTRGSLKSDVRLLNDATRGYNREYGTEFYPPKEPGAVKVWAVVHDNRGGSSWTSATLWIE